MARKRKIKEKIVKRVCLKCDKLFETPPEFRLCVNCKAVNRAYGADTSYEVAHSYGSQPAFASG
jgi:hypothetical protein